MAAIKVVAFDDDEAVLDMFLDYFGEHRVMIRAIHVRPNQPAGYYRAFLEAFSPAVVITDWEGIGEAVLEAVEGFDPRPLVFVYTSSVKQAASSGRAALIAKIFEKPSETVQLVAEVAARLSAAPEGSS